MLNNSGVESKYNISISLDGTTRIKDKEDGRSCAIETSLRLEITDVGPTNQTFVQGRLRNSTNWYEINTVTGEYNDVLDISTYDFIRYVILVADGVGQIVGSGFIFSGGSSVAGVTDHTLLTNIGTNTHAQIDTHIANTSNPHSVTKTQIGLSNADNTSDANKPVSTAQQTALDLKENLTNKATSFTTLNNTLYPTTQAVANYAISRGKVLALINNTPTI